MIISRPQWILTIDGTSYTPARVAVTKDYTALTDVATFDIADQLVSSPALGLEVELDLGDRDALARWPVFRGYIQETAAVAEPNNVTINCSGRLSRLRTTWPGDRDFTGHTDGYLVREAFNESEVVYRTSNIQNAEYVLGALVPFKVTKDTSCRGVPQELNRVLHMVHSETAGEVERFRYSLISNPSDSVRLFVVGEDAEIYSDTRTQGAIDQIINKQVVTGVNYPCGSGDPPECTCTIWAKASGANALLGHRNRAEPGQESSPVIQSSALAEWIAVTRLQESNRTPDEVVIGIHLDPTIRVLDNVGIYDPSPGVHLTSPASTRSGVVRRIEINDFAMALSCLLGNEGTVSSVDSGVDMQCNRTPSTRDAVGPSFTPPDLSDHGWPRIFVPTNPWVPQDCAELETLSGCIEHSFDEGIGPVDGDNLDWEITGRVILNHDDDMVTIGVHGLAGDYKLIIAGRAWSGWAGSPKYLAVGTPTSQASIPGDQSSDGVEPIDYRLRWTAESKILLGSAGSLEACVEVSATDSGPGTSFGSSADPYDTSHGSPTRSSEVLRYNCTGEAEDTDPVFILGPPGSWVQDANSEDIETTISSWDIAATVGGTSPRSASAHSTFTINAYEPWRLEWTSERSSGSPPGELWFGLTNNEGRNATIGPFIVEPDAFLYAGGDTLDPWFVPSSPAGVEVDFSLEWNPESSTLHWGIGEDSYVTDVEPDWEIHMRLGFWVYWGTCSVTNFRLYGPGDLDPPDPYVPSPWKVAKGTWALLPPDGIDADLKSNEGTIYQ